MITLTLPEKRYPATEVKPYKAEMWPGGRLAGIFTTADKESGAGGNTVVHVDASLRLLEGGEISSSTHSAHAAGNVTVTRPPGSLALKSPVRACAGG